ncbi:MAG: benzoyl-CoA 2,3-epoxidase subunit BoxB [bacterium]|nr:benzoyl-CoA 2,3-epoxidase subunit BoxB [bacterium]
MVQSAISNERIPNNVQLSDDKKLKRALEMWQPNFINWWLDMGPSGFQQHEIYLRTAVSVESGGWAVFDYVKMPDYRWGIFLAPAEQGRVIPAGDFAGQPAWNEVPGEFRNSLRRLIVTQADTEPASVEQQRLLGKTCPSLYDLRNLFQVNVEEGRHLWAMVYLLQTYFGRDGRDEAEDLLNRRSGNVDKPRILSTFNEPIQDWLSFFMFTNFTDRDGKFQLLALAESAFDPLSRTCRFMLTEEAHHLFVGQTGIHRVIKRTAELMNKHNTEDISSYHGISLEIIQRYINFWYSSSLDLFGSEQSSNAALYFATGLKGRAHEKRDYDDHLASSGFYNLTTIKNNKLVSEDIPLRNAMNELLRDDYINDNHKGLKKWNQELEKNHIERRLYLPSKRFNRSVGVYSQVRFNPEGKIITEDDWNNNASKWLPTNNDKIFVKSLMKPVTKPGEYASWISPPLKGINAKPNDFEYVKLH